MNFSLQVVEVVCPRLSTLPLRSFLLIMSQTVLKYKQLLKGDSLVLITVPSYFPWHKAQGKQICFSNFHETSVIQRRPSLFTSSFGVSLCNDSS